MKPRARVSHSWPFPARFGDDQWRWLLAEAAVDAHGPERRGAGPHGFDGADQRRHQSNWFGVTVGLVQL
jgi:hypothetical protein